MRIAAALFAICACVASAFGCSHPPPPLGRWEGTYDVADVIVAVRLEIDAKGQVFLSAPDALDFPPASDAERGAMHDRIATRLVDAWGAVTPRQFEFDGSVFRKPGGFAPQMEWDGASKQMTVIVYIERRPGIRIPLRPVTDFSPNPWSGY